MPVYTVISVQYITFWTIYLKLHKFKVSCVCKIAINEFGNTIPTVYKMQQRELLLRLHFLDATAVKCLQRLFMSQNINVIGVLSFLWCFKP